MTSNFPSFQEPHNALSVKVKSSSRFPSIVLSQQPYQLSANSHTEDLPSHSNVMTFQTSAVQDKLKQQVAQILAMYPEGMSLFQFRIAYSATFKQHFPVGNAASTKQRLLEMPDTVYMRGHGVQALLLPVSPDVSPAKPGQPASSKVENVAVVPSHALVHPVTLTKPAVKIFESCLEPAVPKVAIMPVPKPHNSFLQYYESIRAPENNGNKPFTEFHPQSVPGFIKIVQTNTSPLNGPSPKLREISFIPHFCAALPTCSQGTVCGDNLPPGILKSRFASPTNSKISDTLPSVDLTPVPPVSVKPEIYSPRSTSQSSVGIRPSLLVQPPFPILSTEQRNSNHAIAEFDSFSEVQKQSRTLQHFSSPDSSAKRNSVSPLFRNSASFFPPRSQPDHQLQQPTHARLDGLQPSSVSLADKGLLKTSLDRVSPVAMYQREPTYVNPLETSSTSESFSTCSVSGPLRPLHTSSVIANNSMALSSVSSSGTEAVSPASSPIDSIASASANITSNSSPLFPETPTSTQQRQYASAAATVISNKKTTSPTSLSSESTTSSHYQFAYASSRMTTSSSALSSETYAFTHQRQNAQAGGTIIASSTKTVSSISSLDSSTSLSCHHIYASAKPSSRSSVLSPEACAFSYQKQQSATGAAGSSGTRSRSKTPSPSKSTAYHTPNVASRTTLNHDPSSQDNVTSSFSKQGNHYMSLQEKQMPEPTFTSAVSRIYDACLIL
ncbi:cell wall protein RBR3-like [Crotalus tigris]|nr:cell wall protein RBR3-like [Crotalus tigris]